jgi:conjugal transfer ATP-binding protein TraC
MKLPFLSSAPKPAAAPAAKTPGAQPATATKAAAKPAQPAVNKGIETLEKGLTSVVDIIAPSSVEVDFRYIRVGDTYYTTLFAAGYPRYVSPGWLQPIIDYDHTLDMAMFCYPTSSADVLADLKRKIGEMEATLSSDAEQGKVADPSVEAALEDALGLQEELAKGIERFFQFGFYLTISDGDLQKLRDTVKELQTALNGLLVTGKLATLQMEEGFKSTVPLGQDKLYVTRNMDTSSLASTFPFTSAILTQNKGVMYGVNQQNGSLIIFDRFSLENANEVVLGKSGAGKSYTIKLEISRQFMLGSEVIVIDPDGEYVTLTPALGGEVVDFSSSSEIKINPFDLSDVYEEGENELGLKILSLHGLLKIITGELDAEHDAILDRALIECYRQKGITTDPATQKREPPLMEDLYKTLLGMESQPSKELAYMLEKFIKGSAAGIFNQQSNFAINNPLTVFSIRNMEEALRPVAMHIILDFVWTKVKKSLKRRILILDEGWYMMKYPDSASFVYSIAKRARKYYLGLTTATQDVEDFLKNEYGKAVLTNSSIQVLLKQGTAEVDMIAETFYLSEGEKALLLSSDVGEGLFFAGQNHVAMKVFAAPFEHELITSNPIELLKRQQDKEKMLKAENQEKAAEEAATAEKPAETPPETPPSDTPEVPAPHSYSSHTPPPSGGGGAAATPTESVAPPTSPAPTASAPAAEPAAQAEPFKSVPTPTEHVPGSPAALAAAKMAEAHAAAAGTDPSAAPILPKLETPFAAPEAPAAPAVSAPVAATPSLGDSHAGIMSSTHVGGNVAAGSTGSAASPSETPTHTS